MDAARQVEQGESERQTWEEICAQYRDQFVCLFDLAHAPYHSPEILSARVAGHGPTFEASVAPTETDRARYGTIAVRYTGTSPFPLVRPTLIIDDEVQAILDEPLQILRRM